MITVRNVICGSVVTYPTSNLLCINNELRSSDRCREPFVETCNGWCVEVVRRVDGTSNQEAQPRRGPVLISEAMGTLNDGDMHWCSTPKQGGSLWCTIFYSGLELSGSSRKSGCSLQASHQSRNWRIARALYMVEVSISGSGGVLAAGW